MLKYNRVSFGSPDYLKKTETTPPPIQPKVIERKKIIPLPDQMMIREKRRKSKFQRD